MKKLLIGLALVMSSTAVQAQGFLFDDIDQSQLEGIMKDFSNVFMHTGMSSASSLGTVFGMQLGVIGGTADTPNISDVNTSSDAQGTFPQLGLYLAMSFNQFTGELNYLPSYDGDGTNFSLTSFGFKWTLPEAFNPIPMGSLAARVFYTQFEMGFSGTVDAVNTTFDFQNSVTGLQGVWSQSFGIVEPYVGLGYVMASGDLSVTGSSDVFNIPGVTNEASSSPSSLQYMLGAQFNLFIFNAALEYSNQFGAGRTSLKLAASF